MDLKCRVLIDPAEAVSTLGKKLPIDRVCGTGMVVKLFVPNIRHELYDRILEAAGPLPAEEPSAESVDVPGEPPDNTRGTSQTDVATNEVRCVSPVASGLPRSWRRSVLATWSWLTSHLTMAGGRPGYKAR
jgi:hypothetical protein